MNCWKVLCVQSKFEFKVEQQLAQLGIESYLPKINLSRQWSDRKKVLSTPSFPGYLFVHIDEMHRNDVFYIKGVKQYVQYENRDATLADEEVEKIRIAVCSITEPVVNNSFLRKGSNVKITLTTYTSRELIL
ncbi:MAG: UpxY family transcription antiterminator [Saprospiraceae bacterium]|nr:UpxY family transcription antiterminator [Saprospiraceae bacterium]